MPLTAFHPLVAQWFHENLGVPTDAQLKGWTAIREGRHTLIAAPTGSGKTLAAFLTAIDDLVREAETAPLPDEVRVVYVSPLKALSADIHKNLAEPRRGIRQIAEASGIEPPRVTAAVRTGDTTSSERAAILRRPPHILVTTPESLYLLLTASRSRELLRTVRTVIVDEIHAVIGTRRGAHLALSLERLQQVAERPLLRIGLSATQKPVEEVARFLVGNIEARGGCTIVDEGHRRALDVALEIPRSPLGAVMEHEVWEEYYDRITELIHEHRTTLVFVNTRRMAERMARHLSERLGEEAVTAHHGSLSKETRLDAEHRLKTGALKALVATASLELGIDIGHVDLVCQIGSPHRIATFLQRVGRAGHTVAGTPKGRLFATSRDDLIECAALLRSVLQGDLDRFVTHDAPLDVLAQQMTAELACRDAGEDELFAFLRRAWPYRSLAREDFDRVLTMLSEGFATRRGRRAALVHRDEVNHVVRARRGSRMLALTSGGAIPEVADYRVVLEPEDTFIGTLNEDFAIESSAGDIFQLGNASWQITRVSMGTVRVTDAHGAPPTIPFWFGEAPARSDELSRAVSDLRRDFEIHVAGAARVDVAGSAGVDAAGSARVEPSGSRDPAYTASVGPGFSRAAEWLSAETGLSQAAAQQAADYLLEGRAVLGVVPTQETLVVERFFDESGGMQLVVHAPFGSRINRAWALALRKRFCRQFNFELQAAANEDALLLSLGPQHSFPLADVFRYLHPASVTDILVQAFLDAPVFATRWRWNTTISLAVPRSRGGSKVPPQLQRMQADDLMAAVFPDAAACLENIPGDREIPDHPLVAQTVRDCLEEAMDINGLTAVLGRIHRGELHLISRDTPEPSAFSHEIINARPYAFLDDAPLEERRAHAVQSRRAGGDDATLGALDRGAIVRVVEEARPEWRDADELHDALLTTGFLEADEATIRSGEFAALAQAGRASHAVFVGRVPPESHVSVGRVPPESQIIEGGPARGVLISAERVPELLAVHPDARLDPPLTVPPSRAARTWTRPEALVDLLRGRLAMTGPITARELALSLAVQEADADAALLVLEGEGVVLRGAFTGRSDVEWCERRLLARIHRYTLNRLRAEIAPVSAAEFMRFLFSWQHVEAGSQLMGSDGLRAVIAQLDGVELPARAWERDVLPARVERYEAAMLDMLCLTGDVAWARFSSGPTQVVGATPISVYLRASRPEVLAGPPAMERDSGGTRPTRDRDSGGTRPTRDSDSGGTRPTENNHLAGNGGAALRHLRIRGASFASELQSACDLSADEVHAALTELVAAGLVSSDGFAGLRTIIGTRPTTATGRWFVVNAIDGPSVDTYAWTLLRRYGVVFRRMLARETTTITWREVVQVYRRLEARGEIRGGRFVTGLSGEQYALPDAVERLREVRRTPADDRLVTISAADPLNLTGIVTPGDRLRAIAANRIVYLRGVPVSAMEGDLLRVLAPVEPALASGVAAAAAGRRVPVLSGYVGRTS